MFITLKSDRRMLMKIAKIPFLGDAVLMSIATFPFFVLMVVNAFLALGYENLEKSKMYVVFGIYNIILTFFFKIRISIFFCPCWLFFTFYGLLNILKTLQ